MNNISIVTAFFDIGRGDWTPEKGLPHYLHRTNSTYLERFSHLCKLENEIVVFTSEDLVGEILKIRKDNINIVAIDFKNMFQSERETISKIQNDPEFLKKINPSQVKNPEYWSPDYVLVNYLKTYFVNEAIENNFVSNELVSWIDFGYCRTEDTLDGAKSWSYDFDKEKVHLFNYRDYNGEEVMDIISNNVVYILGAKIVASKNKWKEFKVLMKEVFDDITSKGIIDDDQGLMLLASIKKPDLFEFHKIFENNPFVMFKEFNDNYDRKNLVILTSALKPSQTLKIDKETRYKQTIDALKIVKEKFANDIVFFVDGSPEPLTQEESQEISKYVSGIVNCNGDKQIMEFSEKGRKSLAENVLIYKTLLLFKNRVDLSKVKRIFKLSSRTFLNNNFDLEEHQQKGKYVFKKRDPTWIKTQIKDEFNHSYNTRFYSFCISLLDEYMRVLDKNIKDMLQYDVDTEHAHFHNVDKLKVVELNSTKCYGYIAAKGEKEEY